MAGYAIELRLAGRLAVVVGGGAVAARKVAGLRAADAVVRVVSPMFEPSLRDRTDIERIGRAYEPADLAGAALVFACTDVPAVNAAVAAEARSLGLWCNVADDAEAGDFIVPAVHRAGGLLVTVSTGGAGPALAARLRDQLASHCEPAWGMLVDALAEARRRVLAEVADPADRRWILETLCAECSLTLIREQGVPAWQAWCDRLIAVRAGAGGSGGLRPAAGSQGEQ